MIYFLDESFIIAVCFIIFIYISYRPIKKTIVIFLDARINEIRIKLAKTEELKNNAKSLLNEIKREIEIFEQRKKSILDSAHASTQRLMQTRIKEMDLILDRKKDSAILSIENQKKELAVKCALSLPTKF